MNDEFKENVTDCITSHSHFVNSCDLPLLDVINMVGNIIGI